MSTGSPPLADCACILHDGYLWFDTVIQLPPIEQWAETGIIREDLQYVSCTMETVRSKLTSLAHGK